MRKVLILFILVLFAGESIMAQPRGYNRPTKKDQKTRHIVAQRQAEWYEHQVIPRRTPFLKADQESQGDFGDHYVAYPRSSISIGRPSVALATLVLLATAGMAVGIPDKIRYSGCQSLCVCGNSHDCTHQRCGPDNCIDSCKPLNGTMLCPQSRRDGVEGSAEIRGPGAPHQCYCWFGHY